MNPRDDEWNPTREGDYGDVSESERDRSGSGPMEQAQDREGAQGPMEQAQDRGQGPYGPMEQATDDYQRQRGGPGEDAWRSAEHDVESDERQASQAYDHDQDLGSQGQAGDSGASYDPYQQ